MEYNVIKWKKNGIKWKKAWNLGLFGIIWDY